MNPIQSITTCLKKYVAFSGRASRSEYWYFALFYYVLLLVAALTHNVAFSDLVELALFLPFLAAGVRRLQDTNRSG